MQGRFAGGPALVAPPAQPRNGHALLLPPTVRMPAGLGQPLPQGVLQRMEDVFQADLSRLRVHVDPVAQALGAQALSNGNSIVFAPGRFVPCCSQGLQLLGHEVAHVLQQSSGRARSPFPSGLALLRDPALDWEAESFARKIAAPRIQVQMPAVQRKAVAPQVLQAAKSVTDDPVGTASRARRNGINKALSGRKYGLGKNALDNMLFVKRKRFKPKRYGQICPGYGGNYPIVVAGVHYNIPYDYANLFACFDQYAQQTRVIHYTGARLTDFAAANNGHPQPPNTTWHHVADYAAGWGTMQLVDTAIHGAVFHRGGVWQWEQATGAAYG